MRKWTRQSRPNTKIDWSNPLTKGLKFFGSFHEGFPYEYVKQEHGIPGSAWRGMAPVEGIMAMTINDLDGKNNAVTFPKHDEIYNGNTECTIMCFTRNRNSTVAAGQRPYGHMGTGNDPFYLTLGNDGNFAVVLLTTVASYSSVGADYNVAGVDADRWALWGGTWKNDTLTGRWQRLKDSSPTTTSGVMVDADTNLDNVPRLGFANVGGTNSWNGWVSFAAFWDRALTDAEWNSMVDNPWQVFEPPKKIFALADVPDYTQFVYAPKSYIDPLIGTAIDDDPSLVTEIVVTHGMILVPGDVIIAAVHWNNNSTITGVGFTSAFQEENPTGSTSRQGILYRIVDGSEGSTFTFNYGTTDDVGVAIAQFRGIDINDIWEVPPSEATRSFGEPINELAAPTLTTSVPSVGLAITFCDTNLLEITRYGKGYKVAAFNSPSQIVGIAYKVYDTPVSVGVDMSFSGAANDWVMHHIALKLKPNPKQIDIVVPIDEDLPDLVKFEKPWDGPPR